MLMICREMQNLYNDEIINCENSNIHIIHMKRIILQHIAHKTFLRLDLND